MIRTIERTSRRQRRCDACGGVIERGARYREATATPGEEYAQPDRWSRIYLHAEGHCWGGIGLHYDLSLEAEWREHQNRSDTTHKGDR